MNRSEENPAGPPRRVKRSTASSIQRVFSAMPSKTLRARSARVVDSDTLNQPPRTVGSSTGVRSPLSHGVKTTPLQPGGALAARALSRSRASVGLGEASSMPSCA